MFRKLCLLSWTFILISEGLSPIAFSRSLELDSRAGQESALSSAQQENRSQPGAESVQAGASSDPPQDQKKEPTRGTGWHFSSWKTSGRADYQLMQMRTTETAMPSMSRTESNLMALELESTATLNNGKRDVLDLALQWPYFTQMEGVDGRGKSMHFFNAYGIYKLGLGKPNIRFGQFVIPFGNLPYYETHTRPMQSLFPQSLGLRIERGVSLEGFKGSYDYWLAAMGGDHSREGMARVSRRFDVSRGSIVAGVSGLYGRDMPRFSVLLDPQMDDALEEQPISDSMNTTDKFRGALDLEINLGKELIRAEIVAGRDDDGLVNGQFIQWSHALKGEREVALQAARWDQQDGHRMRFGGWFGQRLGNYFGIRVWVEQSFGRLSEGLEERNETRAGLQLTADYPDVSGWLVRRFK